MTQTDVAERVFDACRLFKVETFIRDNMPTDEISDERIIIMPSRVTPSTYWENCFVTVNWCVPDKGGEAQSIRLKTIAERMKILNFKLGDMNGKYWRFKKDSDDEGANLDMRCHYVSKVLLFQIQNIK